MKLTTSLPIAVAWAFGPALVSAADERPPFERLFELNSAKIFGVKAKLEGDRITLEYKRSGPFSRGFEGSALFNPEDLKSGNHKIVEQIGEGATAVGRGDGDWLSRFELSGDLEVSFKLWIPAVQRGSQFGIWLNKGSRGGLQVNFFQAASLVSEGRVKKTVQSKELQGPPEKWYERKDPINVQLTVKDGKLTVKMEREREAGAKDGKEKRKREEHKKEMRETVVLDDLGDATAGRIAFNFKKLQFALANVKISGKVDLEWVKKQLQELEGKGELSLKDAPGEGQPPTRKSVEKPEDDKAKRKKEAEVDL